MNNKLFWLSITALFFTSCHKKSNDPTPAPAKQTTVTVTTLAGGGAGTATNGTGAAASFRLLQKLTLDSLGNIYVGDAGDDQVRMITAAGVVTTVGTESSFPNPVGVALDAAGDLYVSDYFDHLIFKMTAGSVKLFAGGGAGISTNGPAASATFNHPEGICLTGNTLYVADLSNNLIRKINLTAPATVSTFAGSGSQGADDNVVGTSASFNEPVDVAVDKAGNVYVADLGNNLIRKISPAGAVTTLAGGGTGTATNGTGVAASFSEPSGLAVDAAGNVYIADADNYVIRKITPAGIVTTLAGNGTKGVVNSTGAASEFSLPGAIAVDAKGENIYVSDDNLIRKITITTN